jgi:hypothetical protein
LTNMGPLCQRAQLTWTHWLRNQTIKIKMKQRMHWHWQQREETYSSVVAL